MSKGPPIGSMTSGLPAVPMVNGQPLHIKTGDDSLALFKEHFGSLTPDQQQSVYSDAIARGRDLCRNELRGRENLFEGDVHAFFPFASVPLADFEQINAIWAAMDAVMGKSQGVRFVIDEHVDIFILGAATCYTYKSSPVIHFEEIYESRIQRRSSGSTTQAFVLHGKDTIFVRGMYGESRLQKMRDSSVVRKLMPAEDLHSKSFETLVKRFNSQHILSHEWGHIRSFADPAVGPSILNPIFEEGGKDYLHPSHHRFHDMGEVYAELFGVMDTLLECREDDLMLLSLAYYARNLTSVRKNGRTIASAVVPLFLRSITVDAERGEVRVDYDRFEWLLRGARKFFYKQFKAYQKLSAEELEIWIDKGHKDTYLMVRKLQEALGVEPNADSSQKPQVETVFAERALAEFGLSAFIPWERVVGDVKEWRRKHGRNYATMKHDEEQILRVLSRLAPELHNKFVGGVIRQRVDRDVGIGEARQSEEDGVNVTTLAEIIGDINELLRIEKRLKSHMTSKKILGEGIPTYKFGTYISGDIAFSGEDTWRELLRAGYIDDEGMILPKFDGVFGNFVFSAPIKGVRRNVFRTLVEHLEFRKKLRADLLRGDEYAEILEQLRPFLKKYKEHAGMMELAEQVRALFLKC